MSLYKTLASMVIGMIIPNGSKNVELIFSTIRLINFSTNFLISVNWVYLCKWDLMVPFNKNGLQVSLNNTRVKRRLINFGRLLNASSNHVNRKNSLCSGATSIWRNACLISAISPIFPVFLDCYKWQVGVGDNERNLRLGY